MLREAFPISQYMQYKTEDTMKQIWISLLLFFAVLPHSVTCDFVVKIGLIGFCDSDGKLLNGKLCDQDWLFGVECDIELQICLDNHDNEDYSQCVTGWRKTNHEWNKNCVSYEMGKHYGTWSNPQNFSFQGPYNGANLKIIAKDYDFGIDDSLIDQFSVPLNPNPLRGSQHLTITHPRPGLEPTQLEFEVQVICLGSDSDPHCLKPTVGDCAEIKKRFPDAESGIYDIAIEYFYFIPFPVYCDMDTLGGGWTIFQRRNSGQVSFNRDWDEYKAGFGNLSDEHWLGNEYLSGLTYSANRGNRTMELLVELRGFGQSCWLTSRYASVMVGFEYDSYRLDIGPYIGGLAGDGLWLGHGNCHHPLNGRPFFTRDRPDKSGCSFMWWNKGAGWWWNDCSCAFLNGAWPGDNACPASQGIRHKLDEQFVKHQVSSEFSMGVEPEC